MTTGVTVREATPDDAAHVQRVGYESWHAAYDDVLGEEIIDERLDGWYTIESITHDVEHHEGICYVAERDDEVVGFSITGPSPESEAAFHLYRIYVLPEHWNEGIGGRLLDRTIEDLLENDVERLELGVLAANDVGVSFYESQGFERIEESESDFAEGVREYTYAKDR